MYNCLISICFSGFQLRFDHTLNFSHGKALSRVSDDVTN